MDLLGGHEGMRYRSDWVVRGSNLVWRVEDTDVIGASGCSAGWGDGLEVQIWWGEVEGAQVFLGCTMYKHLIIYLFQKKVHLVCITSLFCWRICCNTVAIASIVFSLYSFGDIFKQWSQCRLKTRQSASFCREWTKGRTVTVGGRSSEWTIYQCLSANKRKESEGSALTRRPVRSHIRTAYSFHTQPCWKGFGEVSRALLWLVETRN